MRALILTALLAMLPGVASAAVVCNSIETMKALKEKTGAEPVFLAQGGKGVNYVIYGHQETGEWIAFVVVEAQGKACNVANGNGFSVVVPK